ncbi:unnamed protein product [Periconia digitata]|uniref:Uncharacterized protein n=1 Tax=Periconia digitata TaxID=1303443 RepID=A0A9W4U517_9PLEO|nr:unnamed protein product [Periconia digitata]
MALAGHLFHGRLRQSRRRPRPQVGRESHVATVHKTEWAACCSSVRSSPASFQHCDLHTWLHPLPWPFSARDQHDNVAAAVGHATPPLFVLTRAHAHDVAKVHVKALPRCPSPPTRDQDYTACSSAARGRCRRHWHRWLIFHSVTKSVDTLLDSQAARHGKQEN